MQMSRSPGPCPHCPAPCVFHCTQGRLATGQRTGGQQGPEPHLSVVRCGHIPLAYPVAVIGVGIVCISNPLLGRSHL